MRQPGEIQYKDGTFADALQAHRDWVNGSDSEWLSTPWGFDLRGAKLIEANLRGADLSGAKLRGANLRGANLIDANLRGADLIDANLRGADLIDANLCEADLSEANLRGADLIDANLCEADLCDAKLRGANLRGANLIDANLRGADLRGADLRGADLRGADLSEADLRGAKLPTYQKWGITWKTDGTVKIGCKEKTIAEWDAWFASDETYETERGTADFERIEAAYLHAKRMLEIYQKYEQAPTPADEAQ